MPASLHRMSVQAQSRNSSPPHPIPTSNVVPPKISTLHNHPWCGIFEGGDVSVVFDACMVQDQAKCLLVSHELYARHLRHDRSPLRDALPVSTQTHLHGHRDQASKCTAKMRGYPGEGLCGRCCESISITVIPKHMCGLPINTLNHSVWFKHAQKCHQRAPHKRVKVSKS